MFITALLLFLFSIVVILLRTIYLICQNGKGQMAPKKSCEIKAKTLIVLGSGGHTTEMLRIVKHLSPDKYSPRVYVHAESDSLSRTKAMDFEGPNRDYKIVSIPRSRQVHQSYLTAVWSTFYATLFSVPVVWNEAPDLILCNGPGTCVPLCVTAFVLKIVFLLRSKIIFAESICRVKSLSLTGKILYFFADNIIVQWPHLGRPQYKRTIVKEMLGVAKLTTGSLSWEDLTKDLRENVPDEIQIHLSSIVQALRIENKTFDLYWVQSQLHRTESCLDRTWEVLNSGHWKSVPLEYRYSYTFSSFVKAILLEIRSNLSNNETDTKTAKEIIQQIDKGILLGAPLPWNPTLLTSIASRVNKEISERSDETSEESMSINEENLNTQIFPGFKAVQEYSEPSMETFYRNIFSPKTPALLKGCIKHWRAMDLWRDSTYLKRVIGSRTVPIEVGSRYTEESWSQTLVTFADFLQNHINKRNENVGYLAQHQLFDQIPELKNDFTVPEYCSFTEKEEIDGPDINAWFGPGGTVSPLHFDPKNNLLCQVFGCKRIILYHPKDGPNLYPYETRMLNNTAQVDPYRPDDENFPNFRKAEGFMCYLKPGEMLYIPPKWWHSVVSLSPSFSISFWWE